VRAALAIALVLLLGTAVAALVGGRGARP